jgi:hypothetical protein
MGPEVVSQLNRFFPTTSSAFNPFTSLKNRNSSNDYWERIICFGSSDKNSTNSLLWGSLWVTPTPTVGDVGDKMNSFPKLERSSPGPKSSR